MVGLRLIALAAAALSVVPCAHAEQPAGWPSRLFDAPLSVQRLPADPSGETSEVVCTAYPDLVVRESGTDSPAPEAAVLFARTDPSKPVACDRKPAAGGIALKTADFIFLGRKGPHLFFEAADPNGAEPFAILDAATGRVLVADSTKDGRVQSLTNQGGSLHLRFRRAVNGTCSLVKNAAACWAVLARESRMPAEIAKLQPPKQACAASYRKSRTAADDPSLISYDVDLTLSGQGPADIRPNGPVGCDPLP